MSHQEDPKDSEERPDAESERKDAEQDARHNAIISIIQGLRDDLNTYRKKEDAKNRRDGRVDNLRFRRERRRVWIDVTAVVAAVIAAALFLGQDIALIVTIIDGRRAAQAAHTDNSAALAQTRDFFQDAQAPMLWPEYEKTGGGPTWIPLRPSAKRPGYGGIDWVLQMKNFGTGPAFHRENAGIIELYIRGVSCNTPETPPPNVIVAPSATQPVVAFCGTQIMTKEQFNKLMTEQDAVTLRINLHYFDAFGAEYETDICARSSSPKSTYMCAGTAYKRIKKSAESKE